MQTAVNWYCCCGLPQSAENEQATCKACAAEERCRSNTMERWPLIQARPRKRNGWTHFTPFLVLSISSRHCSDQLSFAGCASVDQQLWGPPKDLILQSHLIVRSSTSGLASPSAGAGCGGGGAWDFPKIDERKPPPLPSDLSLKHHNSLSHSTHIHPKTIWPIR